MSKCIKCGKEIPEGELFCQECSLNAGSSMFEDAQCTRFKAPPGKMQTPEPVAHVRMESADAGHSRKKKKHHNRGLKAALVLTILLLCGSVGYTVSQYSHIQVEKTRLRTKEADMALRLQEVDDLEAEIDELNALLGQANQDIDDRETEIKTLMDRLADSQSNQSQGEYDLTQTEEELKRLESENLELLALSDDLKAQINNLRTTITTLEEEKRDYKAKADFMDAYVVFVEDNESGYYHTYDCKDFSRTNFWAYSRKLAESQGYKPCPVCQGKATE